MLRSIDLLEGNYVRLNWLVVAAVVFAVLAAGYWYATGGLPRSPAPRWLTARPFAHRGLYDLETRPENSMAAFRAAVDKGHPIELDVHLTADEQIVVIHDDDLLRMTGDPRRVDEVTYAHLQQLNLLGSDERVPRLAEVLALVDGTVPVLIELKSRGSAGPLEPAVARSVEGYDGEVAVMSFNPYSLAWFAEHSPSIPRGQLSGRFKGENLPFYQVAALRPLLMNWKSRPHFVAYQLSAMPCLTTSLQRARNRPVLAWSPASRAEAERAAVVADNVIAEPAALD